MDLAEAYDAHLIALFTLERPYIPTTAEVTGGLDLKRIALDTRRREAEDAKKELDEKARKAADPAAGRSGMPDLVIAGQAQQGRTPAACRPRSRRAGRVERFPRKRCAQTRRAPLFPPADEVEVVIYDPRDKDSRGEDVGELVLN